MIWVCSIIIASLVALFLVEYGYAKGYSIGVQVGRAEILNQRGRTDPDRRRCSSTACDDQFVKSNHD